MVLGPGEEAAWSPTAASFWPSWFRPRRGKSIGYSMTQAESMPAGLALTGNVSSLEWAQSDVVSLAAAPGGGPASSRDLELNWPSGWDSSTSRESPHPGPRWCRAWTGFRRSAVAGRWSNRLGLPGDAAERVRRDERSAALPASPTRTGCIPDGHSHSTPAAYQAGWVEVVREDFGGETYWRVFVRASRQDGSLGEPLRTRPWTFEARSPGHP